MRLIEKRAEGKVVQADAGKIIGYAAVYGPLSEDLGGFRERIDQRAFSKTLEDTAADVRAFVDHDYSKVLGRRSVGTLQLSTDEQGLRVEITPPDTSYANDLRKLLERGDVSQMSFGFLVRPGGESWGADDQGKIRTLTDVELIEVSVVTIPAYPDTSAAIRSLAIHEQEFRKRRLQLLKLRYRELQKLRS